jgi:hypothetical protein
MAPFKLVWRRISNVVHLSATVFCTNNVSFPNNEDLVLEQVSSLAKARDEALSDAADVLVAGWLLMQARDRMDREDWERALDSIDLGLDVLGESPSPPP